MTRATIPISSVRHTSRSIRVLNMTIPVLQGIIWTSQPRLQFVEEQTCILAADEITQQLLRLSSTAFEIDRAQDSDDIFQQELGIIRPAILQPLRSRTRNLVRYPLFMLRFRIQEGEDS